MPRQAKPRRVIRSGREQWEVNAQIDGHRARRYFADRAAAERFLRHLRLPDRPFSRLTRQETAELARVLDRVDWRIDTLHAAVDAQASDSDAGSVSVAEAISRCVRAKAESGRKPSYLVILQHHLDRFALGRSARGLHTVTTDEIETWLNAQGWAPETRRGALKNVRALFSFAVRRRWIRIDPSTAVTAPLADERQPGILTPAQARALMEAYLSVDPGLIPYLALCLFAGLRPQDEAAKITWGAIKPAHVEVFTGKIRTHRRRLVTIQPNLRAWLDLGGDLPPSGVRERMLRVREAAGFAAYRRHRAPQNRKVVGWPWPHDCLRHSFASYHLAQFRDAGNTAHEMGHRSQQMLWAHYRELVTPEDAAEFWRIRPLQTSVER